jgi:hypothetical protein
VLLPLLVHIGDRVSHYRLRGLRRSERTETGLVDPAKVELTKYKVSEVGRRLGMFWSENLLADPKRFLKERFGFGILAHIIVQRAQVVKAGRRVGMFWPKLLRNPERFLVERLRANSVSDWSIC